MFDEDLSLLQAGGVEIQGLHTTIAPRRLQGQTPPTLERYQFVPYVQHDVSKNCEELQGYLQDTLTLIKTKLGDLLNNGNSEAFKRVLQDIRCSHDRRRGSVYTRATERRPSLFALGSVLRDVLHQERGEQFAAGDKLKNDLLLANLARPETLKPFLDVVLENSKSTNQLKIVELFTGAEIPVYAKVISLLNSQPHLGRLDYTVAGLNTDALDSDELQSLDVKIVAHDVINNSTPAPPALSNANLIILNNILHKADDIPRLLKETASLLKPDGFILLTEPTTNFAIPLALQSLVQPKNGVAVSFVEHQEILRNLEGASLGVVQQVSDGFLSSSYLCR